MRPTREEIEAVLDKTSPFLDKGRSSVAGMTYEEGVAAALRWVLGDDDPMNHDAE